jgi:hypothetical protein
MRAIGLCGLPLIEQKRSMNGAQFHPLGSATPVGDIIERLRRNGIFLNWGPRQHGFVAGV